MCLNLLPTHGFNEAGYDGYFERRTLIKGSIVFVRGKIYYTIYKTQVKVCSEVINATKSDSSPNLRHKRLAHMSNKGLQILARKSLVPFIKGTSLNLCDYCILGKQHRVSFQKSSNRISNILDFVYSDVHGPIDVESLGDNKYFLTFIENASQNFLVFYLRSKDQIF